MAIIRSTNNLHEKAPKTFLSFTESAGTNVLRWQNPSGFGASWGIQVGEAGQEQTEVVVLGTSTPAGTAGTLTANTLYEHPANTPIYGIRFDQVVFEKSTSGTAGTATPITGGTTTYQADSDYTIYDDTSGASTDAYRTFFRSSGLSENSTESDWQTFGGPSFYSLAYLRERIKSKLFNADFIGPDSVIDDWINEYKDEMTNEVIQTNEDYALGTAEVSFGTDGLGTITTADFNQTRRVWVTYNGQDKFASQKKNINDFLPTEVFNSTQPQHYYLGDNVIGIKPAGNGGTADIIFYRFGTIMVNDTDELPLSMRPYTKGFVDYGVAQAKYKDNKMTAYRDKMSEASNVKEQFLRNVAPRDKSGPTIINIVESLTGEN